MSITNLGSDHDRAADPRPWTPALTEREAGILGFTRPEYRQGAQFARMIVEYHRSAGTSQHRWEPTSLQNERLAEPFILEGEEDLAIRLEDEADPLLDEAQDVLNETRANLDELAERHEPITAESGTAYSPAEAAACVESHDAWIERDEAASKHHHRRAPRLLRLLGPWAPWAELAGFLFFVAYFLDVPLFQPWIDLGAWTLALAIVVSTILGQTWLVHHAATNHNHGRDAFANGNRQEGEQATLRRNRFIGAAAVTATSAITAGMVLRGTTALGRASLSVTLFMICIATAAGILMPSLSYLAIALDGSKISRERDSLAADLDADLFEYNEILEECRRNVATVSEIKATLVGKTLPDICSGVQDRVDGAYRLHGLTRLLVGTLSAEAPARVAKTVAVEADGSLSGWIGIGIPGAGRVDLRSLFDRGVRLRHLDTERAQLAAEIVALPIHPWGRPRA